MIASLHGLITLKSPTALIVEVGGVGYQIMTPLCTYYRLPAEKQQVTLHIYTHVREDALQLFGFSSSREKETFLCLISVSGVGPKLALNILSGVELSELINAIQEGQVTRLKAIPGVGPKMAGRLVLELKEKVSRIEFEGLSTNEASAGPEDEIQHDALSALVNLGYHRKDAKRAMDQILSAEGIPDSVEALIKEGLKFLAKVK